MAVCLESDQSILLGSAYTAPAMPLPSKEEIYADARAVREWVAMRRNLKQRRDAFVACVPDWEGRHARDAFG